MAVASEAAGGGAGAGFGDDFLVTGVWGLVVEAIGCIGAREPSDSAGMDETQLSARNATSRGNCWRRNAVLTQVSGPASLGASS